MGVRRLPQAHGPDATTAPGTIISSGPYELSFTEVTVQPDLNDRGAIERWEIIVVGSGRTTGDQTLSPPYYGNDSMFAAKDLASGEVQVPTYADFGSGENSDKIAFTPGLPPVRYALRFEFAATYQPQPTLQLLVSELEYSTRDIASDAKTWVIGTYGFRYELPVRELPPKKY
jgi:hypothetical protein